MQENIGRTRLRIKKLVDVLKDKIYADRRVVDKLRVSEATDRISWNEARKLVYRPVKLGEQFGPLWSTFWFKGEFTIPSQWADKSIDLIWIAHYCESLLWINGRPIQTLNYSFGERCEAPLVRQATAGQKINFEVELACNTTYGAFPPERPYENVSPYVLDKCDIGIVDPLAWEIYHDFSVLQQLESDLAGSSSGPQVRNLADLTERGGSEQGTLLLEQLNEFANKYDRDDRSTWIQAHQILQSIYKGGEPSIPLEITAIGEGHLDIAWLWPLAETKRKIIRTTCTQLTLMDTYPEYKFACSQAYFYQTLKEQSPQLYIRVQEKIAAKQWIPVGGSWVEPDCNLPSGESLVRQFLFGQRFFEQELGGRSTLCWLQDAFGFNPQLPQIMLLSGMNSFVTQKLLWAEPKPPFKLFYWQALDGSKVLAHFPPRQTFSIDLSVGQVNTAAREYLETDRCSRTLMSYGLGDGGGGPTASMLEMLRRLSHLQDTPVVTMRSPSEFFDLLDAELESVNLSTWVGELYFPRHRGTFTTQSATKKAMHTAQRALHDTEFLCTAAFKKHAAPYPQSELERLWKIVLLNQFHDILPGTSIAQVHEEAVRQLNEVYAAAQQLCNDAVLALSSGNSALSLGKQITPKAAKAKPRPADGKAQSIPINTTSFERHEVALSPQGDLVMVDVPAYGVGHVLQDRSSYPAVDLSQKDGLITLANDHLIAQFNGEGDLVRLLHKATNHEALAAPGNRLQIYDDHTLDYDAWEIEPFCEQTVKDCPAAHSFRLQQVSPLRAEIIFERKIGLCSAMTQTVRLDSDAHRLEFHCEVDWHESHKLLKVLFPASVKSDCATFEMQFGAVERPTHRNTPYAAAQFEVPGHKWADLSEPDFGLALLSQYKHGFSVHNNEMRLSLLRAPKTPDPSADMGRHSFAYALMPHQGTWQQAQVAAEAFKFNNPLQWDMALPEVLPVESFVCVDDSNLVIDTIKKAENSDATIVRLYECHGTHGTASLKCSLPFTTAKLTNLLEDVIGEAPVASATVQVNYRPFEIITLLLQ